MASLNMFPAALRRSLSSQQTCLTCAKRQASKSARSKRRPKLEVELTANVEHLGTAGQRVQVAPGRMRNHLYPSQLALYVLGGRTMQLDGTLSRDPGTVSQPLPSSQTSPLPSTTTTHQELAAYLDKIEPLRFVRRTTGQDTLHGSVTLQNILSALQEQGLPLSTIEGEWQNQNAQGIDHGKVKKLGEYIFNLHLQSKRIPITVQVQKDVST